MRSTWTPQRRFTQLRFHRSQVHSAPESADVRFLMIELKFKGAEGWKTQVDSLGHLRHEKLGVGELSFSDSQMRFSDLVIPYHGAEDPKLHFDRLFLRNWTRFDIIFLDAQYTFLLRAKLKQLQGIPLPFKISVNRRIWLNLGIVLISIQLFLGLCKVIYTWLLK